MSERAFNGSNVSLKIVKTEHKPNGETVQLIRPLTTTAKSTDEIVGELVNRYDYRINDVRASNNELNTVQQAFGSNLAQELIKTYEGSNLVSDSQQDLIGERYLAEQIKRIQEQQKTSSILDKWGHLLYEGEGEYHQVPSQNVHYSYPTSIGSNSQYNVSVQPQQDAYYYQPQQQQQPSYHISSDAYQTYETRVKDSHSVLSNPSYTHQSHNNFSTISQPIQQTNVNESRVGSHSEYRLTTAESQQAYLPQSEIRLSVHSHEDKKSEASEVKSNAEKTTSKTESAQQPKDYLPSLTSDNINSITIDAYNSPEFKAMLEQLTKPINVPPEMVECPPEWPCQDKINVLAEPIYIPAPQPIVIPAPNIISLECQNSVKGLPENIFKPSVNYYPTIESEQQQLKSFGVRQLDLNTNLSRTSSNVINH